MAGLRKNGGKKDTAGENNGGKKDTAKECGELAGRKMARRNGGKKDTATKDLAEILAGGKIWRNRHTPHAIDRPYYRSQKASTMTMSAAAATAAHRHRGENATIAWQ